MAVQQKLAGLSNRTVAVVMASEVTQVTGNGALFF
jgi:hypothetical protein